MLPYNALRSLHFRIGEIVIHESQYQVLFYSKAVG